MAEHNDEAEVLQLSADVIGNLASVDDAMVALVEGRDLLLMAHRRRLEVGDLDGVEGDGDDVTEEEMRRQLEESPTVKEAMCSVLHKDFGPRALVDAMARFPTEPALLTSCLRALH